MCIFTILYFIIDRFHVTTMMVTTMMFSREITSSSLKAIDRKIINSIHIPVCTNPNPITNNKHPVKSPAPLSRDPVSILNFLLLIHNK